jgi:hypothetical protein
MAKRETGVAHTDYFRIADDPETGTPFGHCCASQDILRYGFVLPGHALTIDNG